MEFEPEAAVEHEHVLELSLDGARHAELTVHCGSRLRKLGRLDEAIAALQAGRSTRRRAPPLAAHSL